MRRDCRGRAIGVIMDELCAAGVSPQKITLVCAVGLHRQLTGRELKFLLGAKVWGRAGRAINHERRLDVGS